MICPHCQQDIPDSAVAKHLAAKGGRKSRRKITPEQQAKMQAVRKAKNSHQPTTTNQQP
jgi:hypothetical protein